MRDLTRRLREDLAELIADESATTTLEYALVLALVAVACILAYQRFGATTSNLASDSTQQLPGGGDGPPPASSLR